MLYFQKTKFFMLAFSFLNLLADPLMAMGLKEEECSRLIISLESKSSEDRGARYALTKIYEERCQDNQKAVEQFQKLIAGQDPYSIYTILGQVKLALYQMNGTGIQKDLNKATFLLEEGAKNLQKKTDLYHEIDSVNSSLKQALVHIPCSPKLKAMMDNQLDLNQTMLKHEGISPEKQDSLQKDMREALTQLRDTSPHLSTAQESLENVIYTLESHYGLRAGCHL